ncbi:MAG: PQQ-dependent sugar dehydrogenase [Christensenellales bacterium]
MPDGTQQATSTSTQTGVTPPGSGIPTTPTATRQATSTNTMAPVSVKLELAEAYPALSFEKPLYFAVAGDSSQDCYVVEQTGRIRVFKDRSDTADIYTFLDLSDRVDLGGNEKGLLGLAFHPDYQQNGYLYVNYTNQNSTVIARYTRRSDNPREADPASEQILLSFPQPYENHNGGQLDFGPDGYLYIATGDGGSGGDPQNNGQNPDSLLGKILRIDVDHPGNGKLYGIPADNPYSGNGQGYQEEIYALGLRNPWRFSFDERGSLWVADVGQSSREEIDLVEKGRNYGWNVMEGTLDFKSNPGVNKGELMPPVWEYNRDQGACVTGGYVYGSGLIPDLKGKYIYGDFVSGRIWALWIDDSKQVHNQELLDTNLHISSFGIDANGDLRIVDLSGKLYRLQISKS